ncbi:hypothetical protein GC170_14470 [bacterium]|nr:hypothetical protein [bacterium]
MPSLVTYERACILAPALAKLPETQVTPYLEAATEAIEEACGRGFKYDAVVDETARPDQFGRSWLWRVPITPANVTVRDNEGNLTSFMLENERGELITPGIGAGGIAKASYSGGFSPVPPAVELAVANLAKRRIDRSVQEGPVTSKKIGSVEIQYEARTQTSDVDEDILASLKKYRRR